jgi:hypothetical protein
MCAILTVVALCLILRIVAPVTISLSHSSLIRVEVYFVLKKRRSEDSSATEKFSWMVKVCGQKNER